MRALFATLLFMLLSFDSMASNKESLIRPTINILASSSLVDVLGDIAREYSITENVSVSITYREPDALLASVIQGEPADLFITEHAGVIRLLKQKGLIDVQSISLLARNQLALVTRRNSHIYEKFGKNTPLKTLLNTISDHSLLAIGNANTTALGILSEAALIRLGVWEDVTPFIMRGSSAEQTLKFIEQGNAGSGIVYYSSVKNNPYITPLAVIPQSMYEMIYYQGAVVAGNNMQNARRFLEYLKSDRVRIRFTETGYNAL